MAGIFTTLATASALPTVFPDSIQSQTEQSTKTFVDDAEKLIACKKNNLESYGKNFNYYYSDKRVRPNRLQARMKTLRELDPELADEVKLESCSQQPDHKKNRCIIDYIEPLILVDIINIIKKSIGNSGDKPFYKMVDALHDCLNVALERKDENNKPSNRVATFEDSWQGVFLDKLLNLFLDEKNPSKVLNKQLAINIKRLKEFESKKNKATFSRNVGKMISHVLFPILVDYLVTGFFSADQLEADQLEEQASIGPRLKSLVEFENNINQLNRLGKLPIPHVAISVDGSPALVLDKISSCKKEFFDFYKKSFQCYINQDRRSGTKQSLYDTRMRLLEKLNQQSAKNLQEQCNNFLSNKEISGSASGKKMEFYQNYIEPQILLDLISISDEMFANNEAAKPFCQIAIEIKKTLQDALQKRTDKKRINCENLWQSQFVSGIIKSFKDERKTSKFLDSNLAEGIEQLYEHTLQTSSKIRNKNMCWLASRIVVPILIDYITTGCLSGGKLEAETANVCQLDSLVEFKNNFAKLQTEGILENAEQAQILPSPDRPATSPLRNLSLHRKASSPQQRTMQAEENAVSTMEMVTAPPSDDKIHGDTHKRPSDNAAVAGNQQSDKRFRYLYGRP
jgi:hypothetical protein